MIAGMRDFRILCVHGIIVLPDWLGPVAPVTSSDKTTTTDDVRIKDSLRSTETRNSIFPLPVLPPDPELTTKFQRHFERLEVETFLPARVVSAPGSRAL
jgi:hypothetical protein